MHKIIVSSLLSAAARTRLLKSCCLVSETKHFSLHSTSPKMPDTRRKDSKTFKVSNVWYIYEIVFLNKVSLMNGNI
jgi:hypothetical protein